MIQTIKKSVIFSLFFIMTTSNAVLKDQSKSHYTTLQFDPGIYEFDKKLQTKAATQLEQLEKNEKDLDECQTAVAQIEHPDKNKLLSVIEAYRKKNPIFMISECRDSACGFTREKAFGPRHLVERTAINVLSSFLEHNKKLILADFGSGDLYSELIILDELFKKFPHASIELHCIDEKYSSYLNQSK